MARIWFDTEFIEDGRTIELLSIGMVRDDGEEYYAEIAEADHSRADQWVRENVLPHLSGAVTQRSQVASEIIAFAGYKPEFWAWYCSYDWVVLCQLFGRMVDLPKGWPMFCRDVRQLVDGPDLPPDLPAQVGAEHNALADAHYTRRLWEYLANG